MKCSLNICCSIKYDVFFLKAWVLFVSLTNKNSLGDAVCLSLCPVIRNNTGRGDPEPDREPGLPFHLPGNQIPRIAFLMPIR